MILWRRCLGRTSWLGRESPAKHTVFSCSAGDTKALMNVGMCEMGLGTVHVR